jgi:aryl-alcohol dehydrogenase-like predicted oxidoreductase
VQRRALYGGGPTVGCVGFGAWGIGGATPGDTSYGATDDDTSIAALRQARALGIDLFDTSPAYGDGHSERLIGSAMAGERDSVVLSSKAGIASWRIAPDLSPDAIRASVRGSLGRLGTDRLDVLLLHSPVPAALLAAPAVFEALDGLVADGVLGVWGISCKAPADALAFLEKRRISLFQVNLNMLDLRAVDCGLLEVATREGIGIIARTPLCFGFLAGTVDETSEFAPGDHRRAWSPAQRAAWADGARQMMAIAGAAPGDEAVVAALRFCLSFPAVSCVLPGALTPTEVEAQARAGCIGALPEGTRDRIVDLYRRSDFFVRG